MEEPSGTRLNKEISHSSSCLAFQKRKEHKTERK